MKLAIVSPEFPFSGRVPLVPPILEYLAALTMREAPDTEIKLIDANQTAISPADIAAGTVAISAMTATAPWAYRFADECRKQGKKVILGGIHPTALPDEAASHADAVVIGEAESVWGRVLNDVRQGTLQTFYRGERLPLENLPTPIDGKLKGNYQFRAFFTMRGCPYRCSFCSVRTFFGDTIRYRPIGEVVNEIEQCAGKLWFNGDDNIWGGDIKRSIGLFDALAQGTKRHWYGFGDLRSIQGNDGARMLAAARRSGLFSVWVGWEGEQQQLGIFNASGKQGSDRIAAVKQMQDAGIDVTLFVVLGGRQDSIDSFKRTLELSERLQVGIHPVLLTPLPGTELYEQYRQHLIPGLGWDAFTGVRAVFEHPSPEMTPARREEEYHRLSNELFRFERIAGRVKHISSQGFPATHLYSFMMQLPMKHALSKAYGEWKETATLHEETETTPVAAVAPENAVAPAEEQAGVGFGLTAGSWCWLACITAVLLIDVIEDYFFGYSWHLNNIELSFFIVSFVAFIANQHFNRRRLYRYIDILINWSQDRWPRRYLMLRQTAMTGMYGIGWYVCHLCVFHH